MWLSIFNNKYNDFFYMIFFYINLAKCENFLYSKLVVFEILVQTYLKKTIITLKIYLIIFTNIFAQNLYACKI